MYLIFRCDCGRVLYAKKGVATRKCTCGKTIKVKSRRILQRVETAEDATYAVQKMQEEIYGGSMFSTAEEFKQNKFLNQIDRKMKELTELQTLRKTLVGNENKSSGKKTPLFE
jgi:histone acetyltransferase (RNA polymerase elongator complex component)